MTGNGTGTGIVLASMVLVRLSDMLTMGVGMPCSVVSYYVPFVNVILTNIKNPTTFVPGHSHFTATPI